MLMNRLAVAVAGLCALPCLAQEGPPVPPTPTPVHYVIDESGCASGGPKYYFFDGGKVVVDDCGDECPYVSEGTWSQAELALTVVLTKAYVGRGDVQAPGPSPARTQYRNYKGEVRTINKVENMLWDGGDGCVTSWHHDLTDPTAGAILKGMFQGDFPFLSTRPVTDADLAGKSKDELALMRNEVFAAWGHVFKTERFATHFKKKAGYVPRFSDVTAFLTPLETANVAAIKAAEAKLAPKK